MQFVIFSDIHLNDWKNYGIDRELNISKRLKEQWDVLEQIDVISKKYSAMKLFLGDMFHKYAEIPVNCLNIANKYSWDISVIGNHDLVNRIRPKWFDTANIFSNTEQNLSNLADANISVKIINYNDIVDYNTTRGYDIVLLHKTPLNCKVNNYIFTEGVNWKELAKNNRFVFFGHIHERQALANNCIVVGSPLQLNFSDKNSRGVYLLNSDDWSIKFIKLKYPEFLQVDDANSILDDNNYYKLVNAKNKIDKDNVISILTPKKFDTQIKSDNIDEMLTEWLNINKIEKHEHAKYLDNLANYLTNKNTFKKIYNGRLRKVEISNFMSVDKCEYSVKDGFYIIKGLNKEFNSNGSGKTSIVGESIYWALYGETTKELKGDEVIRDVPNTQKDCMVKLTFDDFTINRSRKKGINIIYRGEDISTGKLEKEKQLILERQILGLDKHIFKSAIYFSQESLSMLTQMSDVDKTDAISYILGFEQFNDIYALLHKRLNEDIAKEKIEINNNILRINSEKMSIEKLVQSKHSDIASCERDINLVDCKINNIKKQIADLTNNKIVSNAHIISDDIFKNKLTEIDIKLSEIDKSYHKIDNAFTELNYNININALKETALNNKTKIAICENNIKESENRIDSLLNVISNKICITCGSEINSSQVESQICELNNNITENKTIANDLLKVYNNINNRINKLEKDNEDLLNKQNTIKSQRECMLREKNKILIDMQNNNIAKHDAELKINKKLEEIKLLNRDLDNANNLRKTATNRILTLNSEIQSLNYEDGIKSDELIKINTKLNNLDNDAKIIEFWKSTFGHAGIRTLLFDKFCNDLNEIINEYVAKISLGTFDILVSPTKQLKSGENRNKISIIIRKDGKIRDYKCLSGGEKRRVDIAMCLSLNKYIKEKYVLNTSPLGLIILDELFSHIDKSGEEAIASVLLDESLNTGIFCISHTSELESYSENIWTVVKENGISKLIF